MRNEQNMRLKGQLKLYMRWPMIMSVLLVAMNIWIYMVDTRSGIVMSVGVLLYILIVGILYLRNRTALFADLVQFADQYTDVQNILLKELSIPYALVLMNGQLAWWNNSFEQLILGEYYEPYLNKVIPELNRGVYPKTTEDKVEMEITYNDRQYAVELRKVSMKGFSNSERLLHIPADQEYFIALYMRDITELKSYMQENEEQRLIAGLIYIDNYDEVMESVEEVRQSLLVALIDRKINQYIGNVDGIVKKLEKDKYFIVIKKQSYLKMAENKFSILEDVKDVNIGNARSATLPMISRL